MPPKGPNSKITMAESTENIQKLKIPYVANIPHRIKKSIELDKPKLYATTAQRS
jgi:hypothetical protein